MKKLIFAFILISLLQVSCEKNRQTVVEIPTVEETKYMVYDSMIRVTNNMPGGGVVQENHYPLSRNISIYKNIITDELVYNTDTFVVYKTTPLTYSPKSGSFPLLGFSNDSLSIYRHLGGVGTQTWEYLRCVKQ